MAACPYLHILQKLFTLVFFFSFLLFVSPECILGLSDFSQTLLLSMSPGCGTETATWLLRV